MESLNVSFLCQLGRGSSGIVYKVQHNHDGRYYVIKAISLSQMSEHQQKQAQRQVQLLSKIQHPHLIRYYSSLLVSDFLYILMQYAPNGDLQNLIRTRKSNRTHIQECDIWKWSYQIALGLQYLHSQKIVHRDLKCMNVYLDSEQRIKIGDFGVSTIIGQQNLNAKVGTPLYLSPEQVRRLSYGLKVDIWAFGCILYNLCALECPFLGDHMISLAQNIATTVPKPIPAFYSNRLGKFIEKLLEKDQNRRPESKIVLRWLPEVFKKNYRQPLVEKPPQLYQRCKSSVENLPPLRNSGIIKRKFLVGNNLKSRNSSSVGGKKHDRVLMTRSGFPKMLHKATIQDLAKIS